MDYMFRWLSLRFLSGQQLTLFAGLALQTPQLPPSPSLLEENEPERDASAAATQQHIARLARAGPRFSQVS